MLVKLTQILIISLVTFGLSIILYPFYIALLKKLKAWQSIRDATVTGEDSKIFKKLHKHKEGTPTMGGGLFIIVMLAMIWVSYLFQKLGWINNNLLNRQETYVILFGFFSMGLIGLVDDFLNIRWHSKVKWLSSKAKLIGMFIFAWFISRWFYAKLGVDYINLWPLRGKVHIGLFAPIITFVFTIGIVNAINITDGLDGLAWWLMSIILFVLGIVTFTSQTYIATAISGVLIACLIAFLWFNIHPAKIFMGDSWAFALGGFLATLLFVLNMRMGILIPFTLVFAIFIVEVGSSGLQIFSKKVFKRKLFSIAPFHHYLEHKGIKETTIVMKFWLIQAILAMITIIVIFYQISNVMF